MFPRPAAATGGSAEATEQALVIAAIEEAARHIRFAAPLPRRRPRPRAADSGTGM